MSKFTIELECDEWYAADALREISNDIENNDLLDNMQDGQVTTSGEHYTATIKISN